MRVHASLPQLQDWKAQVKCQAGCPVATDAGRYVQLIAEGRTEEAYLVARAPNPFASVSIRALKRHVCEAYGVESIRPDTQIRLLDELVSEGNRYAGHLPVVAGT